MSILLLLLPLLIQGCTGQLFSVEPQAEYVVRQGDSVTLECVAHSKVASRTWKVRNTELGVDGFFLKPIPPNLGIVARHPDSDTDNSITLTNVDMRYDGQYICSPFTLNGVQEDAQVANVIVAQKPVSLSFNDRLSGFSELTADVQRPAVVSCEAREARPAASIAWYLGNQQLYDGVDDEVEVVEVVSSGGDRALSTTRSTLTHRFIEADDGNVLRCVASHAGYDDQDVHETSIVVNVQYAPYRPKGNDVGTIYGFTEGQEGRIIINFTANPQPQLMEWKMGENLSVPTGARSVDGRFTANDLEPLEGENNMYALSLLIKPILREDRFAEFSLVLENRIGRSALNFNLGTGPAPPPQGLSPGALGGIVVLVLLLLIVVALVAFARSRGKWCFAATETSESAAQADDQSAHGEIKKAKRQRKTFKFNAVFSSLMAKKKDADLEMADNKNDSKQQVKSEGNVAANEVEQKKRDGEVVYAELILNSDGKKSDVRPSAEKSEYAVIVGTKKEGEEQTE